MHVSVVVLVLAAWMTPAIAAAERPQTGEASQAAQIFTSDWATTIRMDKDVVKAGSEIRVWIDFKNISNHAILVSEETKNPRVVEQRFRAYVRTENGALAPETKWGRKVRTGKDDPGEFTIEVGSIYQRYIQPGQTRTDAVRLSGMYDLGQPGKYTVQLEIPDEKGSIVFKTNTLTFTVTQ
jgi:hypothetical protein